MNHFECVTPIKNKWYWYLLVLFLCFIISNTIGAIPLVLVLVVTAINNGAGSAEMMALSKIDFSTAGVDLNLLLVVLLSAFAVMLIAAIFIIKFIHARTWTQVINGTNRVRWSRFFFGMLIWGIISLIFLAISFFTEPENISFQFQPVKFFILLVIALIFIPLQTSCEEFLFRGYLAQGVATWTKSRWWALIIPSVLFGLLHSANPEIKEYGFGVMMFQYIFLGLLFGLMTVMDDGIELAMGVHAINNLFGAVFVNYKGSALQTYALFEVSEMNPADDIIPLILSGIVVLAILARKYKWNFKIFNQKVAYPGNVF